MEVLYVEVSCRLAEHFSDNFYQEFVALELAKTFGVSDHTIEYHYSYLKEAFLLQSVYKFSYKSKECVRYGKVYMIDVAFVLESEGTFSTENIGWRLESVVYIEFFCRFCFQYANVFGAPCKIMWKENSFLV